MNAELTCTTVEAQLAEFAAGTLPADQRGAVEAHLNVCAGCRSEAESLIDIADSVLLFAPVAEPPAGFEARVLDRMQSPGRRLPKRGPALVAVAAAAVVVAIIGAVAALAFSIGSTSGDGIEPVALRTPSSNVVGTAFIRDGEPGWILVDMAYHYDHDGSLSVQIVQSDGTVTAAGPMTVRDGHGVLGFPAPVPLSDVRELRMVAPDGTVVCNATVNL